MQKPIHSGLTFSASHTVQILSSLWIIWICIEIRDRLNTIFSADNDSYYTIGNRPFSHDRCNNLGILLHKQIGRQSKPYIIFGRYVTIDMFTIYFLILWT